MEKIALTRFDKVFKAASNAKKLRMAKGVHSYVAPTTTRAVTKNSIKSGDFKSLGSNLKSEMKRNDIVAKPLIRNGKVSKSGRSKLEEFREQKPGGYLSYGGAESTAGKLNPEGYTYITHGGTESHVNKFMSGKSKGYRLEGLKHNTGIQVNTSQKPKALMLNRAEDYADRAASTSYGAKPKVMSAKIKNKYLTEANNAGEAGLQARHMKYLENVKYH